MSITKKMDFKKSELIFNEGDYGEELYIILSGEIEISKNLIGENKKILAVLKPHNFFGEISILDNKKKISQRSIFNRQ